MLIVVGATGYIGNSLFNHVKLSHDVLATTTLGGNGFIPLQLDSPNNFNYSIIKPYDVVFVTAAISAPDVCAREHERAWAVNVKGTSEFVTKVMARGGRVIFFSSDTVYGHRSDAFDERAVVNPAGEYALMKHEVEKRFFGNPLFKSIRLSYVFSREDKFTQYLSKCNDIGEEAELFHPFYRSIIHRDDVIKGSIALAEQWDEYTESTYNFGGPALLSRIEFAETLKNYAFPNLRFQVKEPDDEFFRNRPRVIAMTSKGLGRLLCGSHRSLIEATKIEFDSK